MRLLIQRASEARLTVNDAPHASIAGGFVVLIGVSGSDVAPAGVAMHPHLMARMLDKLVSLRVFPDEAGKMNLDIAAYGGEMLVVSQFTLYADCRKGRRPSFHLAAPPEAAEAAYDRFVAALQARLPGKVHTGCFGADMRVHLTNWGPVTIMLDSDEIIGQNGAQ